MTASALLAPATRRPLSLATALAAAAGVAAGLVLAPGASHPASSPGPKPRVGLASGVARLPLPADWRPLGRRSALPGLGEATAVRAGHTEAALDIRRPDDASLLPASLVAAAGPDLSAPRQRGPVGRVAWRYDLPGTGPGARVAAYALPTTGGVITIACAGTERGLAHAAAECERAVSTVRLEGAAALRPARETAAAIVLPDVMARLNRARTRERRRLAATRSPAERHAAARRLAAAYTVAASTLRPVADGAALPVAATLAELAHDHRALAAASLALSGAAARRAGARINHREQQLARGLATLTGPRAEW